MVGTGRRARAAAAGLALVLIVFTGRALDSGNPAAEARVTQPPNFLLIVADDQAKNSFRARHMPRTFRSIVDRGTTFTNGLAAPPLCCPDRAGILTGQYPHHHGVFSNHPGYPALRDRRDTLPLWLDRAGYRTGLIGKFLNRYISVVGRTPAPGFDRWFAAAGGSYYDYKVNDDGARRRYGHRRRDYSTDVFTRKARRFIGRSANSRRPFFLWLAYNAPHVAKREKSGPCRERDPIPPTNGAYRAKRGTPLPRPASFNERRVADKPRPIRSLPRLSRHKIKDVKRRWHCTLAAMAQVDRGIGKIMGTLRRGGELRRTIVIYLSDNGLFFGEHRIPYGKAFVYQPALEVPYVVRVPRRYGGRARRARSGKVVSNQDIAPTILAYARRYLPGAGPCAGPGECRRMDGRSLVPLLGKRGGWPKKRGVLVEIDSRPRQKRPNPECHCAYAAIRTGRYVYSEISTGARELYDLKRDPQELRNRASSSAYSARRRALASRLDRLRRCSGVRGRDPRTTEPFCE